MTLNEVKETLEAYGESRKRVKNLLSRYHDTQQEMYSIKAVRYDQDKQKTNEFTDKQAAFLIKLEDIKQDIKLENAFKIDKLLANVRMINKIPLIGEHETTRIILELKYIDCYTVREITEYTGISRSRVFDYLKQGLAMLADE